MKFIKNLVLSTVVIFFALSCEQQAKKEESNTTTNENPVSKIAPEINYSVVNKYPHDINSFTEGFLFHDSKLFESTGSPSNLPQTLSLVGIVDLKTGKIDTKAELNRNIYFGEGIVILNNKLCQLTYTNQVGFIYDAKSFQKIGQFSYQNKEGWGMTSDGTNIIMSDGTYNLTYLDTTNFNAVKTLAVTDNGYALDYLNELEYINGFIYANVWTTHLIVKINPVNGEVVGKLDLTSLFNQARGLNMNSAETNGIAYDATTDKILVTGKMWPTIFEISFPH